MENDSNTKKVTDWVIFCFEIFEVNDLRSNVSWGSTSDKKVLLFVTMSGETKISNYTIVVIFVSQDDVFRFKIPVHDPLFMHVFKPLKQPLHHCLDLGRREFVLGLDLVVELATL